MLRKSVKLFTMLVGLVTAATSSATAAPLSEWKLHGWLVGAYSNNTTNAFSHCAASIKYRSGILLLFSVTKEFRWMMGFANPQWQLNKGSRYKIRYAVDSFPALEATAVAISPKQVVAELPPKTTLFQLFRTGKVLKVQGEGQNFGFKLDNTSSVLASVLQCANRYKGSSTPAASAANPFVKPSSPSVANSNDGQKRAEAAAVTANVLSSAGIQGFSLVSDIPASLKFLDAIWKAPGLLGGLQILDTHTPDTASSRRIAIDAQNCKGTFASGKLPASGGAVRVMSACTVEGKAPRRTEYTVVRRGKGGVYLFILMGSGNAPADVGEHGTRVMDAAVKSLR